MHVPVLLNEVIEIFKGASQKTHLRFFDGTFGRGGHAQEILKNFDIQEAVFMDQDVEAIDYAQKLFQKNSKIKIIHDNFINIAAHGLGLFDFILVDLGVSSPQLDQAQRGFSFYANGPLDMRMNQTSGETAADIVNSYTEEDLIEIFKEYGEVYSPFRVVRAIIEDRKEKPFQNTQDLAGLIERIDGWRVKGHHPATKYFLALRLKVNNELGVAEEGVLALMNSLSDRGRLVVLTFHSLEDRIVKNIFKNSELGRPVNKKVIQASWNETKSNIRARSAKLRAFERISS